jgi:hypothetical protein
MASAAPVAAAAVRARKRVLGAFRDAGATTSERAIGFQPQRRMEEKYFDSLVGFGAIVATDKGTFWLDEAKAAQHTARRRKRAAIIMGSVLAAGAAVIGITLSSV